MVFIEFSIGFKANVNENTLHTYHTPSVFWKYKLHKDNGAWSLLQQGMGTTKNPVILDSGSLDVLHCEFGTLRYIICTYTSHTHTHIYIYVINIRKHVTQKLPTLQRDPQRFKTKTA